MHFKLNGWTRIGIILSVLWILGAGVVAFHRVTKTEESEADFTEMAWSSCNSEYTRHTIQIDSCMKDAQAAFDKMRSKDYETVAAAAFIPIPVAWLFVFLVIFLVHWIKRGFQRTPAQRVQAAPEVHPVPEGNKSVARQTESVPHLNQIRTSEQLQPEPTGQLEAKERKEKIQIEKMNIPTNNQPEARGDQMQIIKKIIASILIAIFALMLIGASVAKVPPARSTAERIGQIIGYLFILLGLFYSTRWRLKLAGRCYKVGRQSFAALWFCESILGILLGFNFIGLSVPFGVGMIVVWSLSLWATYRWLKRLRSHEVSIPVA